MKLHDKHYFNTKHIHNEQIILINLYQKSHTNTKMLRFKNPDDTIHIFGQLHSGPIFTNFKN
jgi:hypothetical protein